MRFFGMEADAGAAGPLALAAPTAARSARLSAKLYLPTAAIALQLPAGLSDLSAVPRLQAPDELNDEAARLDEYVQAIRATAKVFETYQHKTETLIEYDAYIVWVDAWLRISGFGAYFVVDLEVRRGGERASGDACASMHLCTCS